MARPSQIDRPSVLTAGLAIADRDGLAAVTMQSVALQLGVTPMALYRHVENKADLLDGLVELLLTDFAPPPPSLYWRDRLRWIGRAVRQMGRRHPSIFGLLLQRPAATTGALQVREVAYGALAEAGLPDRDIPRVERVIGTAILGFVASEVGGRFAAHAPETTDLDFAATEVMVDRYLDALTLDRDLR